ncbi:hypothetical protein KPL70_003808 [Citrus sinensis]|nr:hypothetical protein KPL70_003808 [Citrus sinensis]
MRRSRSFDLLPFDPEIECTCRRLYRERREALQEQQLIMADEPLQGNEDARPLRGYVVPTVNGARSSTARPAVQANNFEIKPGIIHMIQTSVQFAGMPNDDPNAHIANFLEICDTFKQNGVSDNAIRLRFFPFSLRDKAKEWLNSLPTGTIITWDGLAHKFLAKYFPLVKTAKLRNDIKTFAQFEIESLYEAWERYKDLLRKCPHHGLPVWLQVQTFCNGLRSNTKTIIDVAAGGTLIGKTPEAAYELLEEMASNNYQWSSEGNKITYIPIPTIQARETIEIYHGTTPKNALAPPLGFQPQEKKSNFEDALTQLTTNMSQFMTKIETTFHNQVASIRNLEVQVGQIANLLSSRQQGSLPSNTEMNPREQVNATVRRSGKQLDEPRKEAKKVDEEQVEDTTKVSKATSSEIAQPKPATPIKAYVPRIPFPQRLRKNYIDKQFLKFLDAFKKLHINIPFADALEQMPLYAKCIKEMLSNKRKFKEHETVMLTEDYTAILQNKLPQKLKDPGSFNIPCTIGNCYFDKALCDLGRSIKYLRGIVEDVLVKSNNEDPSPYFRGKRPHCKNFVQGPSTSSLSIHEPP